MKTEFTKIAQLLQGPEAQIHYTQLSTILDNAIAATKAQINRGLAKEAFATANQKLQALQCSKMVLKSIQIYNQG